MLESYLTVKQEGRAEIVIRGSRFICTLKRVYTEEEAKEFVQAIKKEHWKATHNCSAYVVGEQNEVQRAHDDGEPSGTAGVPMLEVLKKNDLRFTAAVVTRYFGGTKLGAGGLIRAYSKSVATGLREVGIVQRSLQTPIDCTVSYSASGKLENWLGQSPYALLDTSYTDVVTYRCGVPTEEAEAFQASVTDLMSGRVTFTSGEEQYVETDILAGEEEALESDEDWDD